MRHVVFTLFGRVLKVQTAHLSHHITLHNWVHCVHRWLLRKPKPILSLVFNPRMQLLGWRFCLQMEPARPLFHWDQLLMIPTTAETSWDQPGVRYSPFLFNSGRSGRSSCFSLVEIIRITDNSKTLRSVGEETLRKVLCNPALHLGNVALRGCHSDHLLRGSFAVS